MSKQGPAKRSDSSKPASSGSKPLPTFPSISPKPLPTSTLSKQTPSDRDEALGNVQEDVADYQHLASKINALSAGKNKQEVNEALLKVARENQPGQISLLVDEGADINYKDPDGLTALHIAAHNNYIDFARILLSYNSQRYLQGQIRAKLLVNPITNDGYTPLHSAAERGHYQMAQLLLSHYANVEAKATPPAGEVNGIPITPIVCAYQHQHREVVDLLITHGAKLPEALTNPPIDDLYGIIGILGGDFDDDELIAALEKAEREAKPPITFARDLQASMPLPYHQVVHQITSKTDEAQPSSDMLKMSQ